jgi:hypothetical protein
MASKSRTPSPTSPKDHKADDIRALKKVIKALEDGRPMEIPSTLEKVLLLSAKYDPPTHTAFMIDSISKNLAAKGEPLQCLDTVASLLESRHKPRTIILLFETARNLIKRMVDSKLTIQENQIDVLSGLTAQYLEHETSDLRRAAVELAVEIFDAVGDKEKFWNLLSCTQEKKDLVVYYVERKKRGD